MIMLIDDDDDDNDDNDNDDGDDDDGELRWSLVDCQAFQKSEWHENLNEENTWVYDECSFALCFVHPTSVV
jgi:hypothetical protein